MNLSIFFRSKGEWKNNTPESISPHCDNPNFFLERITSSDASLTAKYDRRYGCEGSIQPHKWVEIIFGVPCIPLIFIKTS